MEIKGFSLLEVMLVVLVLGIVAGMVTLNFKGTVDRHNPEEMLQGLTDWCDLMRQESILRQQAISVVVEGKTAAFFAYEPDTEKWLPVTLPHYFIPDVLTSAQSVTVQTESETDQEMVFLPNGRLRAFTLTAKFSGDLILGIKGLSEGQCARL